MVSKERILVLIDGNAIIHRAYHALPKGMSTRDGQPTNAVYGFTTTLIKVLEDLRPEYLACSFDLAGPTFRHEVFDDYKATRVKADQELYDQIPRVKQIVETFNIPIYEKEGFEADDCLGTIVERTKEQRESGELELYIVSGDKDIYQLINGNVFVYSLRKGLSQMQVVDRHTIKEEYNLDPEDFIDLKALAGDPSDNIPGVPGIGPKTATELIQKFDTLEGVYQNLDSADIKPRIRDLLADNKEQAFLSQHLATIHRNVPIEFNLDNCLFGQYDKDRLRQLFEELGFQSLLRRFGAAEKISHPIKAAQVTQRAKDEQLKLL